VKLPGQRARHLVRIWIHRTSLKNNLLSLEGEDKVENPAKAE